MTSDLKKILIVEDDPDVADYMKRCFEQAGYAVLGPAITAHQAVTLAAATTPDMLVSDIKLSGEMDGIDLCKYISTHYNIPVLLISGYHVTTIREYNLLSTRCVFLEKPFTEQELLQRVSDALNETHAQNRLKETQSELSQFLHATSPQDMQTLQVIDTQHLASLITNTVTPFLTIKGIPIQTQESHDHYWVLTDIAVFESLLKHVAQVIVDTAASNSQISTTITFKKKLSQFVIEITLPQTAQDAFSLCSTQKEQIQYLSQLAKVTLEWKQSEDLLSIQAHLKII